MKTRFILLALLLLMPTALCQAFVIQSSVSSADDRTRFIRWPVTPVDFLVDGGSLHGGNGVPLVVAATDTWDAVPTARDLTRNLYVADRDFNLDNLGIDYGVINDGVNEIVFDETGRVLEYFGLDPAAVAGVSIVVENTDTQAITDAMVVMNGLFASSVHLDMQSTLTHELGHVWGLGHTFLGVVNLASPAPGSFPMDAAAIPTMYPWENPVDDRWGRDLARDDEAAVSRLYPETAYHPPFDIPWGTTLGTVRGRVFYKDRLPLTGVHVRAVNALNHNVQVGCLSGYDAEGNGVLEISGLPPGSYHLVYEAVDGRDGIWPYIIEDDGIGACCIKGFPEQTALYAAAVGPGTVADAGTRSILQLPLQDDETVEFGLPDGFSFDFMGLSVRRLFLCSNGYLTFNRYEDPDPSLTKPEADLHQFLSRPIPRIALFRSDLDPLGNADFRVEAATGPGQVVFSWHNVAAAPAGTLPVWGDLTLYNNGNFRFDYGETGNVVAIVGYTAGAFDNGGLEPSYPIYAYPGQNLPTESLRAMYDVGDVVPYVNRSYFFPKPSTNPVPARSRLLFPWLSVSNDFNMGMVIVSNSSTWTKLRITAYDVNGLPLAVSPGAVNPAVVDLGPFQQFAAQIDALFPFAAANVDGWIQVESDNADPYGIQGFFMAEGFYNGVMDAIDGAKALSDTSTTVVFPHYAGGPGEYTDVTIVNPNASTNKVTLWAYFADGSETKYEATVAPNGAAIFRPTGEGAAYLLATGEKPIAGFTYTFNNQGSLGGQHSQFLWEARTRLVSPHFIYQAGEYASQLDIVNPGNDPASVTVSLYTGAGVPVGAPRVYHLAGWYNARIDITPAEFGFPASPPVDGWLNVTSDRPVLGTVTFGAPGFQLQQTTLTLQNQPVYCNLMSHLAQGLEGGIYYDTGLAALSLENANEAKMDVYDAGGVRTGQATIAENAGQRVLGLLDALIPGGTWPQVFGYLTLEAPRGQFVYEIFCTSDLAFYASVPAQRYLFLQEESQDATNGFPEYPEPITGFPKEVRGWIEPGDTGWFINDIGDGFSDTIEDLYQFTVPKAGRYLVSLYPDNRYCDLDLYLFDKDWKVVASALNGVPGPEFLELDLAAGSFYLGVSLLDVGWFKRNGYWLLVEPDAIN